jgi:hypothetical protein
MKGKWTVTGWLVKLWRRILEQTVGLRPPVTPEPIETMAERQRRQLELTIRGIDGEINECYAKIADGLGGIDGEALYLDRIRRMEDLRFQLLARLNGDRLEGYNTLPS